MTIQNVRYTFVFILLLLFAVLLGCAPIANLSVPSKPVVSIGSPAHGTNVNLGQEVLVQVIAADTNGIARVELWVDGALVTMSEPTSTQTTHSAILRWTPTVVGAHMLMAKAINASGITSDPMAITVNVVAPTTPTVPPTSNTTPTAPTTVAPTQIPLTPAACENNAIFVEHVTVPDSTNWMPGQAFNKIWRVRNTGTCIWGPGYELVFVGGEAMTTQTTSIVPVTAPGATADTLIAMVAPTTSGSHSGQWRLRDTKTGLFGATMNVTINVLGSTQTQPQPPQPLPPDCPGAPVIASFGANPATITTGQSTTLSWGKVNNATSAAIDQGIGGIATPGSTTVKPATTTTYTLSATGCGGTATKQVTVTVTGFNASALPTLQMMTLVPIVPFKPDLAITGMHLVSTTGPSRLHVDVKNTGNGDFNGSFNYKCVVPQVMQRGTNQMVAALGDEGSISRSIPKGGTVFFDPIGSMSFDATLYSYPQVICVVDLNGDLTPDDNQLTITIP